MALQPGFWGIDIGQCALKAVRLQLIDNKVTATAFDYVEHPKILSQPDADPDALTREALEKFLSRNPIKGDKVAIGVPGQSGLARFVKLPPVEEKKIERHRQVRGQAADPLPARRSRLGLPESQRRSGRRRLRHRYGNRPVRHEAGHDQPVPQPLPGVKVEVHCVQMAPLALCNYITYDLLKRGGPDGETTPPPTDRQERNASWRSTSAPTVPT